MIDVAGVYRGGACGIYIAAIAVSMLALVCGFRFGVWLGFEVAVCIWQLRFAVCWLQSH
jgi:hypothetical protein